jgi:energy-coupling factor transporter ATP-binding protein EcfA2
MTIEEIKTPASETSEYNKSILTIAQDEVNEDEPKFLHTETNEENRLNIIYKVMEYYVQKYKIGFRSKELVEAWHEKYCRPKFDLSELKSLMGMYAISRPEDHPLLSPVTTVPKSKRLFDLIVNDSALKLFHDQNKIAYVRIINDKHHLNVPINSAEFTGYVRHKLYKTSGDSVSEVQLKEALSLLNARAIYENDQSNLFHRVAQVNDVVYYDLMNKDSEVVRIDENGWSITSGKDSPLIFKTGTGRQQVRPEKGGDIKEFLELINLTDSQEQMIFISTLPVRLLRNIDQAIMYIFGPAGSGKSTLLKMTKDLLDPSNGGISMPINKIEDAGALLNQTWVFANDNISKINDDMSDFLCIVATGAESSRRKLYTDSDISVLSFKNPIYITGVNVEAYRSDLLSRTILLKTDSVDEGSRVSSSELYEKYEQIKPLLLGSIFDVLSKAIKVRKELNHRTNFRMADFSLWGASCAEVLGYGASNFEQALSEGVKSRAYDAIYSLSAGRAIIEYLDEHQSFEGTVTELFKELKNEHSQDWYEPIANSPASLGKKLRELENSLNEIGIVINFKARSGSERRVEITKK